MKRAKQAGASAVLCLAAAFAASPLPTAMRPPPRIDPSALPALASSIVGGLLGALPTGLIPPPPARSH